MIRIPCGRSGHPEAWATIDMEDYERVAIYRWYLNKDGYPFVSYSKAPGEKKTTTFLHNFVLGRDSAEDGRKVDHIDRDVLNARKSNLRVVTQSENCGNTWRSDGVADRERMFADAARRLRADGFTLRQIAGWLDIPLHSVILYCGKLDPGTRQQHRIRRSRILRKKAK